MKMRTMTMVIICTLCASCATTTQPSFEWGQQRQSPDAFIQLVEESREMKSSEAEITYRLECRGFPAGDSLEYWAKNEGQYKRLGALAIDEQGKARWKSKTGTGGQYSLANLIAKGINKVAGREDADIVRIILGGNALGKGIEVAVYNEKNGQVAFGKAPFSPTDGTKP